MKMDKQHTCLLRPETTLDVVVDDEGRLPGWLLPLVQQSLRKRVIARVQALKVVQQPYTAADGTKVPLQLEVRFTLLPRVELLSEAKAVVAAVAHIEAMLYCYASLGSNTAAHRDYYDHMPDVLFEVEYRMRRDVDDVKWPKVSNFLDMPDEMPHRQRRTPPGIWGSAV